MKFDIAMIGFGLAVLVWQRYWLEPEAERTITSQQVMAAVAPSAAQKNQWEITYPAGSPYQDLTPPPGVIPNPFLEVQRLVRETGPVRDYAGKDTDLRLLLARYAKEDYYFVIQQQAANEMLRRELFPHYYQDPTHQGMLAAVEFYVNQLEEAGSEDAKLIYMGLQALNGYWSQKKIAQLARAAAHRVKTRSQPSDTTTAPGYYRHIYARELQKLANRLDVDNLVDKGVDKDSGLLSSTN